MSSVSKIKINEESYDIKDNISGYLLPKDIENLASIDLVNTKFQEAISAGFKVSVVEALPTENISHQIIYLVLNGDTEEQNVYDEYVYTTNSTWERIGSTKTDLSDYALKTDVPRKTSELENDSGFINGYTETDPTVPNHVKNITTDNIEEWDSKASREEVAQIVDLLPKGTVSGTDITLTDSADYKVLKLSVDGKSEQETRSGKNKLDLKNFPVTGNGITRTINADGSITLNGTATAGFGFDTKIDLTLSEGTYTHSIGNALTGIFFSLDNNNDTMVGNVESKTFSIDTETTYANYYIWIDLGTVFSDYTIYPMICAGEDTDYEQYGVGQSPSPEYPSEIKSVTGIENLFNGSSVGNAGEYLTDTGEIASGNENLRYTDYIKIPIGANKLTVSGITSATMNEPALCFYDINKTFISGEKYSGVVQKTFNIPSNAYYFRTSYRTGYLRFQIEAGTIAHEYIPYGKWLPVRIKSKSLLDPTTVNITTNGVTVDYDPKTQIITLNGACTTDNTTSLLLDRVTIPSGKTAYARIKYISGSSSGYLRLALFDAEWHTFNRLAAETTNGVNADVVGQYTTTEDTTYVNNALRFNSDSVFNNLKIQVYVSDYDDEFEEYKETEMLIDLKGNEVCSIGDIEDTLEVEDGNILLIKRIGKIVLDGSETWFVHQTSGGYQFDIANPLQKRGNSDAIEYICDKFVATTFNERANHINSIYTWSDDNRLRILTDVATTVAEFKTWLKENNVTVCYVLETPEIISLGTCSIPKTYKNVSRITLTDDLKPNLTVKYMKDLETLLGG